MQLCFFTAHVGKTTQQHNWQNRLHFPPFCLKSHEETMVSHWLIDSSSSAHSSQPREVKNIKHDRYFPQGLERSNLHENYPHTRETCWACCHARRLAQQVALVCGRLKAVAMKACQYAGFRHSFVRKPCNHIFMLFRSLLNTQPLITQS
jgi:hypothetical protein